MRLWMFAALALAAAPLKAQPAPATPPCSSSEYRQFDFWVGDWQAVDPRNGNVQGTNLITREYGGCVIVEHWAGNGGGTGTSFNIYDATRQVWHQTWVDDHGTLLVLEGKFEDGKMVLQSTPRNGPDGRVRVNRITWTPVAGGHVTQHWEVSTDGGTTWQTSFLGEYRPRS